jgi:hypothetical protein
VTQVSKVMHAAATCTTSVMQGAAAGYKTVATTGAHLNAQSVPLLLRPKV